MENCPVGLPYPGPSYGLHKNMKHRRTLQERTNIPHPVAKLHRSCGYVSNEVLRDQREKRYLYAEETLTKSIRRCSTETPPHELQIKALQRATDLLAAHVREVHQRAAQLRQRLVDREQDPEKFEALKRQRWMEEHRESLVNQEEKLAREQLVSLARSSQPQSDRHDNDSLDSLSTRKQANLVQFLQSSSTRLPLSSRARAGIMEIIPRRMTISDVSALRLCTSSRPLSAFSPLNVRNRTRSLPNGPEGQKRRHREVDSQSSFKTRTSVKTPLSAVIEDEDRGSLNRVMPILPLAFVDTFGAYAYPRRHIKRDPIVSDALVHGNVLILPSKAPRSSADILAGLNAVVLPSYAVNLMEEFVQGVTPSLHLTQPQPRASLSSPVETPKLPKGPTIVSQRPRIKRRSIFSIHLPSRLSIDRAHSSHPSHTSALSRPSVIEESESRGQSDDGSSPSPVSRRPRGLRSTRNWDLAQLAAAPDDVQEPQTPLSNEHHTPRDVMWGSFRGPKALSVVNKVKQGLSFLGRT